MIIREDRIGNPASAQARGNGHMTSQTLPTRRPNADLTPTAWRATFTRRWHANPDMCHSIDPVGWHSGRMGVLALHIWGAGASRDLLVACLCHDLGEHMTGDVAWPAKQDAALGAALDRIEEQSLRDMGMGFTLSAPDQRKLKFLDRLDAYLWVMQTAPHVLSGDGWPEALAWLERERAALEAVAMVADGVANDPDFFKAVQP